MTYNFWREITGLPDPMLSIHCSTAENVNKQEHVLVLQQEVSQDTEQTSAR